MFWNNYFSRRDFLHKATKWGGIDPHCLAFRSVRLQKAHLKLPDPRH
jgi:hypothetical protein